MIKEDEYGGFGKKNEETARMWCLSHVKDHDNSTTLAEECAAVFDFYLDSRDYKIPERLYEIALKAMEGDLGEAFGKYMNGILNEENHRDRVSKASVEAESYSHKRIRKHAEATSNLIKFNGGK